MPILSLFYWSHFGLTNNHFLVTVLLLATFKALYVERALQAATKRGFGVIKALEIS